MFVETGLFIPLTRENVSSFHLLSHDSFFFKQQEIIYSIFQFTPKSSCNSKLKASAVLLNNSTGSVHRESNVPDPAHVLQIPAQSISPPPKNISSGFRGHINIPGCDKQPGWFSWIYPVHGFTTTRHQIRGPGPRHPPPPDDPIQ
jgi:hypothetical protein